MKRDCIRDFIDAWKQYDNPEDPRVPPWNLRLCEAKYHSINLTNASQWSQVHQWCREKLGEKHYAWVGNTFWFETERDAILFALRWT